MNHEIVRTPAWSEVRESLTAAIREALPLQVRKAGGERVAGVGLHMDAADGAAGHSGIAAGQLSWIVRFGEHQCNRTLGTARGISLGKSLAFAGLGPDHEIAAVGHNAR